MVSSRFLEVICDLNNLKKGLQVEYPTGIDKVRGEGPLVLDGEKE